MRRAAVLVLAVLAAATAAFLLFGRRTVISVDGDGFFVGAVPASWSEVHAGPGVRFVFAADPGTIAGRLADPVGEEPAVWVRGPDGLTREPLRTRRTDEDLAARVHAVVVERLSRAGGAAFVRACGGAGVPSVPESGPAEIVVPPTSASPIAGPGRALESLAPKDWPFVRFRSVEAAYRFGAEVDRIAAALLAAEARDARDYGTLRLLLHDLLLPTIWRTNPESERGVEEVGVTIAPPFTRGRLFAAALLRITDPELHRMQTQAGVAEESSPGHLWRPPDDPFPEERERRNFRVIRPEAPDVEVVATSAAVERAIANGDGAARSSPEPKDDLALVATLPYDDRSSLADVTRLVREEPLAAREAAGMAFLAAKWFDGRRFDGPAAAPASDGRTVRGANLLWALRTVRVTTDIAGARIVAKLRDAAAAESFRDSLLSLPSAGAAVDAACVSNLTDLVPLALVENPQEDLAERNFVVLGWKPVCPCGGTYSVHPITREVSCSVHGTARSPKPGRWTPPAISEIAVHGAELSFRLAIDWNRRE